MARNKYYKKNKFNLLPILLCIAILSFFWFNNPFSSIAQSNEQIVETQNEVQYHFESKSKLDEHFKKHGKPMGFKTKEEYETAASKVVNNPNSLHKNEKEDNDDVYYLEETNEFVIVSTKGYIRTYFYPDSGKLYFEKQ